jgi:hypothetical protein
MARKTRQRVYAQQQQQQQQRSKIINELRVAKRKTQYTRAEARFVYNSGAELLLPARTAAETK